MRAHTIERARQTGTDGAHQLDLARTHRRDTDLDLGHAGGVQILRDGELLGIAEGHTSGLLAITQRGVVDRAAQRVVGRVGHLLLRVGTGSVPELKIAIPVPPRLSRASP